VESPRDVIALDYVLTRIGVERERESLNESLKKWLGEDAMDQPGVFEMGTVSFPIINKFQDHFQQKYGGAKGYSKDMLGFDDNDLSIICNNIKRYQ
jgi:Tyrosine phosphatase family